MGGVLLIKFSTSKAEWIPPVELFCRGNLTVQYILYIFVLLLPLDCLLTTFLFGGTLGPECTVLERPVFPEGTTYSWSLGNLGNTGTSLRDTTHPRRGGGGVRGEEPGNGICLDVLTV